MNLLFVLRGLPGSGKSTFIKRQGFVPFTIEPDKIRMLFGGIEHDINGNWCIPQSYDIKVWALVEELLCNRLEKGITTFLDATSISMKSLNRYKTLCSKYGTKMYVVDFTNIPLDVVKSQNNTRDSEYKKVPEEVIDRMNEQLKNHSSMRGFNVIEPNDVNTIIYKSSMNELEIDANKYDKVIVFGDIHGCHSVLYKAMSEYNFSDKNLYVFCGDYFDRGIENDEVFEFCLANCKKENFIFLKGNHELHIKNYLMNDVIGTPAFKKSLDQICHGKEKLKDFYKTLKPYVIIKKGHTVLNISHGGIVTTPNNMISEYEYIKGVGKYQDSEDVDNAFTNSCHFNEYSVHGHRNIHNIPIHNTEKTYNLEGQVELGGFLRYIELCDDEIKEKMLQNNVFDETLANKHLKSSSVIDSLNDSELIRKKELADGIVSYNFTRDAFYKATWNKQTITARGLFLDKETGNVIARSYNKFFTIEERPETEWRNLRDKLAFPVTAYLKENGFLGIVSYNPKTDDLFIASKSTNEGEYAENFKRILLKQIGDKKDYLKDILKHENRSAIFECIDPVNDPHIIEYAKEQVVLLDIIQNDFSNTFMNYTYLKYVAEELGVKLKERVYTFDNFDELKSFIDSIELLGINTKEMIEGYVLVDKNRYILKYKTPFYRYWKNMRKFKNTLASGKDIKEKLDDFQKKVVEYMKNTYTAEELTNKSIIEIRNELLKQ